jgi:hypothetical protein
MSNFQDLKKSSLNKMSRDEYLYIKYKTKYYNLKHQLEGGVPGNKSVSSYFFKSQSKSPSPSPSPSPSQPKSMSGLVASVLHSPKFISNVSDKLSQKISKISTTTAAAASMISNTAATAAVNTGLGVILVGNDFKGQVIQENSNKAKIKKELEELEKQQAAQRQQKEQSLKEQNEIDAANFLIKQQNDKMDQKNIETRLNYYKKDIQRILDGELKLNNVHNLEVRFKNLSERFKEIASDYKTIVDINKKCLKIKEENKKATIVCHNLPVS